LHNPKLRCRMNLFHKRVNEPKNHPHGEGSRGTKPWRFPCPCSSSRLPEASSITMGYSLMMKRFGRH
jgi:hypothetical protein